MLLQKKQQNLKQTKCQKRPKTIRQWRRGRIHIAYNLYLDISEGISEYIYVSLSFSVLLLLYVPMCWPFQVNFIVQFSYRHRKCESQTMQCIINVHFWIMLTASIFGDKSNDIALDNGNICHIILTAC